MQKPPKGINVYYKDNYTYVSIVCEVKPNIW